MVIKSQVLFYCQNSVGTASIKKTRQFKTKQKVYFTLVIIITPILSFLQLNQNYERYNNIVSNIFNITI